MTFLVRNVREFYDTIPSIVVVALELVKWLEELLLLIKSLHVLRHLCVFLRGFDLVLFELRRKLSLNLLYIIIVVGVVVVIEVTPLIEDVELLLLWICIFHDLLFVNLIWHHLLGHSVIKLLIIVLD